MALLSKAQILAADDLPFEDVEVPAWGGTVRVRTMTAGERDQFEFSLQGAKNAAENFRARLLAATIVDASGSLMFSEADIAALSKKSAVAADKLVAVAMRLSAVSAKDQKDLEKN